jgi:hypothetical protein
MEEYIIYVVIAISVVANIYKNFKKQQEANEKRTVGAPASKPQPVQAKPAPAPTLFQSPKPDRSKSLIESDIEQFKKGGRLAPSVEYTSLESSIGNYSSLSESSLFVPMEEGFEDISSIEEDDIKDEKPVAAGPHPLFATKDDFKKAIIYNAVFERKYA